MVPYPDDLVKKLGVSVKQGEVRISGGEWRGRKLKVLKSSEIRPTPDRVRETLFNWLAPVIRGAYCLDAFAGSGVLGFEALSRGASHVVLMDQDFSVVTLLQEEAMMLRAADADIYQGVFPKELKYPKKPFDIVFLDPPYQSDSLLFCCHYLEKEELLAEDAFIYLEAKQPIEEKELPASWKLIKSKKAGQVAYHLARRAMP